MIYGEIVDILIVLEIIFEILIFDFKNFVDFWLIGKEIVRYDILVKVDGIV